MNIDYFEVQLSQSVHLALPLLDIEMVMRLQPQAICPIPGVNPCWLGVVNHTGNLLWVLDGDRLFELGTTELRQSQPLTAVLLSHFIQGTKRQAALVVKELEGVVNVETKSIKAASPTFPFTHFDKLDGQSITILDSTTFFQSFLGEPITL